MTDSRKCQYPDDEGGMLAGKHSYDKDGFCRICGDKMTDLDKCPLCGKEEKYHRIYWGDHFTCPKAHQIAIERGEEINRLKRIAKSALTQDNRSDMESCIRTILKDNPKSEEEK